MKRIVKIVPESKYGVKCPYPMTAKYITIHNTANDATAENEIAYMTNNDAEVSFHFAVDDQYAIQGLHTNRNSWSCGDGQGEGNRASISVEICYSKSGGERFDKAEKNCAKLVAELLLEHGLSIDKVVTHKHWSGKNCPERTLANGWERFLNLIRAELEPPTEPSKPDVVVPSEVKMTITLPATETSWRVYPEAGPYTVGNEVGKLAPSKFGGLTYDVVRWVKENETAIIDTESFGRVGIYVAKGTGALINHVTTTKYVKDFSESGEFYITTGKARYICDTPSLDSADLGTVAPATWTKYSRVVYNDGRIWCLMSKGWVSTGSYDANTLKRTESFANFR